MVKFIVDSTFCVSKQYALLHEIKIVNLRLILDGVETKEGFPDEWDDFFNRLHKSSSFPTTSQANPQSYEDAIEEIYKADEDAEIIILTIAGALSGTINSAKAALQKYEGRKIAAVDSHNVSACSLMMLEEMVTAAEEGDSFDEVLILCESLKQKLSIQFIPDTMTYLQRGGRVGKLSSILASIISIKPVFDFRGNKVSVPTKALGLARGAMAMIKRLPEKIKKLYVCYIHDNKNVPMLLGKVKKLLGIDNPPIFSISPVFGVHVGIGAIGLACMEG